MKYYINPHLILEKDHKILLLYRENTSVCNQVWCTPTGGIEEGESPSKAMVREAFEEIGTRIQDMKPISTVFYRGPDFFDPSKPYFDLNIFFKVLSYEGTPFNKEPHKHKEIQWFDIDNLPHNILPLVRHGVECYKNNIAYSEFLSNE